MTIRTFRRRGLAIAAPGLLGMMLFLAMTAEQCAGERADCSAEPVGAFTAYLAATGSASPAHVDGRVTTLVAANADGFRGLILSDGGVQNHLILYHCPQDSLPVAVGDSLGIDVEVVGGSPSASALVIHDARGLRFAGVVDQQPGAHVLKQGLAGFQFALRATDCASRAHGDCYRAIVNADLAVTVAGETRLLGNGQVGTVGGYRVRCLTAQRVEYQPRCADAGLPGVSFTVTRDDASPPR